MGRCRFCGTEQTYDDSDKEFENICPACGKGYPYELKETIRTIDFCNLSRNEFKDKEVINGNS